MEVYHNRFSRVVPGKSSLLNGTVFRKKVWSSLGDYFLTLSSTRAIFSERKLFIFSVAIFYGFTDTIDHRFLTNQNPLSYFIKEYTC